MIKNAKRIIACTLIIGGFSTLQMNNDFMMTKAYASSEFNLKSIYLSDGKIDFSPDVRNYTVRVNSDVDRIRIAARPDCTSSHYDDYTIDINETEVKQKDNFRTEELLLKGENEVKVRIENKETQQRKVYTLKIIRGRLDTDSYGSDIFLKDMYLDYGDTYVNFDKDTTSYNVDVDESMDQIAINAIPNDDDNTVRVDGTIVKEDKDDENSKDKDKNKESTRSYKKIVKLAKGKNAIEIEVSDDNNQKIYTVNINRRKAADSKSTSENTSTTEKKSDAQPVSKENATNQTTNNNASISTDAANSNKWVKENGVSKYLDENGQALKNTWFKDKSNGKEYFLKDDGAMATGWQKYNNAWYYLGDDGSKKIDWQYVDNKWYYLNSDGTMKTDWLQLGDDWYYLNPDGTMKVGWIRDSNGKYYNFGPSGKMAKNTSVDGYIVGEDGAWID